MTNLIIINEKINDLYNDIIEVQEKLHKTVCKATKLEDLDIKNLQIEIEYRIKLFKEHIESSL